MKEVLVATLTILGAFFFVIAAVGVVRFPDLLTRMHAATKAGAFGGGLLLLACAVQYAEFWVVVKAAAVLIFFYLTAPIAGHLLGRAGYRSGSPLAAQTHRDDMAATSPASATPNPAASPPKES
jgi:multicomponent Na+:H+ antiporter subunit G